MNYRRRHANGDWIWINSVGKVTEWDRNHQPLRMIGIHTDITERKRSEEKVLQRNQQLQVLSRASQQVNSVLEIPVVMRQLVSAALELTGATDGAAGLMMGGKMVFNEYNLRGSLIPIDYRFDEGYGVPGWVMHSRASYLSNDAEHDPHVIPEIQKALGFINLADVPIFSRTGDLLGCFEIHNKAEGFDDADLLLLKGLSASAAIALENAQILVESKQLELELQKSEISLKKAQLVAHVGSWTWHTQTNQLECSDEMFSIFGIDKESFTGDLSEVIARAIHPDDRARVDHANLSVTHDAKPIPLEYRVIWPDGTIRVVWAEAGESIVDEAGNITSLSGIVQDITERKHAETDLSIAAIAFESQEGMIVTDAQGTILKVNNSFTKITGYGAEEIKGKNPRILQSGRQNAVFYVEMWERIKQTGYWEGEIWNRRKNGDIYPEHLTISAVRNQDGRVTNYVGTLADITMSKAASEEIQHLAFYDALTGLPNRRLLQDRLKQAFASSARSGNDGALLFIDLDNFKTLNDTLGHDFGDLLLQQIAERLTGCVREGDTVARFGGDEFVVMLEDLGTQDFEAATLAETIGHKILAVLNQPYQLGTHTYHTTGSIGATLFNDHKASIDELLKQADIALYQAKSAGRNAQCFFDPQMQVSITNRVALENELRLALENHQLQLYYQIQVDSFGQALGAEALIRWLHPQQGVISPAQFIPLAEDTGLILPIGLWVLESACAQLESWRHHPVTRDLTLSVNVSAKQYRQAGFVDQVRAVVQKHAFNPMLLKLELTESLLLDSVENTIAKMGELQKIGIQFSLDDFGTGYSSLQYLKRLPLNQLKIDQSFVRDIFLDSSDQAIVRTIIAMAKSLNLGVIAEGVETDDQRALLMHNGCTQYQGYLFGKPVPIEQFEALLKRG